LYTQKQSLSYNNVNLTVYVIAADATRCPVLAALSTNAYSFLSSAADYDYERNAYGTHTHRKGLAAGSKQGNVSVIVSLGAH